MKELSVFSAIIIVIIMLSSCQMNNEGQVAVAQATGALTTCETVGGNTEMNSDEAMKKSEAEWKQILTPEQFRITRLKGTENAFTGKYYYSKEDGTYRCVCCGSPLFKSTEKYDSGSGWPSFWAPYSENSLKLKEDSSLGLKRIEVMCAKCDAHLGHVFDDGPKPTGKRYCINSAALQLETTEQKTEQSKTQSKKP